MEAETSRFNLINVNATYFTSTPTVCGHAEACPSTTYTNYIYIYTLTAVAARWAGVIPQQKLRPAGWVLPDVK